MEYEKTIQNALNYIDENIKDELTVESLARKIGYSPYHFSRIFSDRIGISVISYVTWRKLQYALYDLSLGRKVIDTAMEYGFDTHAGFTKAFRKCFGYPPSLCYMRVEAKKPQKETITKIKHLLFGGIVMNPHIYEFTPFSVVGFPQKNTKPKVRRTADIPTFWNTINMEYSELLSLLYDTFPLSKHCEISMCYDADEITGEFKYLLGRGIDNPKDLGNIRNDMTRVDVSGGLYAVFSTPIADDYIEPARETWNEIFTDWLPKSEFEYDDTRYDFEYHDRRDHGEYFGGKVQIDICIPIRQKQK